MRIWIYFLFYMQELFVEYFAKEAHKRTVVYKRKTLQRKDLGNSNLLIHFDPFTFLSTIEKY